MNIFLLCGGYGERLWPISYGIRTKQFIKFLAGKNGECESMLQRVFRQIKQSYTEASITIIAHSSHKSLVEEQLGYDVNIILEPERRGTFPAICLAAAYLKNKGFSEEETLTIIPVDFYIPDKYSNIFKLIHESVHKYNATISLMGIKPTSPSSKYGYIIPFYQNGVVKPVECFIEKPDIETATRLINEGAFWNGGVFSFKLQLVLNLLNTYIYYKNFDDLIAKYDMLPKNSFDYEVVEKVDNIVMVSYNGTWEDIGTWDSLLDKISYDNLGKVIVGEESENTYVINELDIPIIVLGTRNLIVVTSKNGILISEITKTPSVKQYINMLEDEHNV